MKKQVKHYKSGSLEYKSWDSMKQRCLNKKCKDYKNYGGRGIKLCGRWMDFKNFFEDMGERPKNTTLDRIDNDKGYYKENCKWATIGEQMNNTSRNHFITYKGETMTISQWAKKLKINKSSLLVRLNSGWSIEEALTKPIRNITC